MTRLSRLILWLILLAPATLGLARADEVVILSATAMRSTFSQAEDTFKAAAGGNPVRFVYGTAGETAARVKSGTPFDLAVLPPKPLADLAAAGFIRAETQRPVGSVAMGLAIRAGDAKPAIGNLDEFKATLRNAKSIGFADPASGATTGVYFADMLKKIGLFDEVQSRLKLYPDGTTAMEALARGELSIAAGQYSEAVPVKGIEIIGPLPKPVDFTTVYAAGLAAGGTPKYGLLDALRSPEMKAALAANGFAAAE
jgi:molybdate transport system substrate-binding protein